MSPGLNDIWKNVIGSIPNLLVIAILVVGGLFLFSEMKSFFGQFSKNLTGLGQLQIDEAQRRLDELNRQYKQLADNIARSKTEIVSPEELKQLMEEAVSPLIREQMKHDNAEIKSLHESVAGLQGKIELAIASTQQHSGMARDSAWFDLYTEYVRFADQDNRPGMQVAQVNFDAGDLENPWRIVTDSIQIRAKTVAAQQPSGNFEHFVQLEAFNNSDPYYRDYPYRLKVTESKFYQERIKNNSWFLWAPHLESGVGASWGLHAPFYGFDFGFSVIAYGLTRDDNYLRFLRLGIGVNDEAVFGGIYPIGLNLKTFRLPILKDSWIFPGLSLKNGAAPGFAASFSTTL